MNFLDEIMMTLTTDASKVWHYLVVVATTISQTMLQV